MFAGLTGIFGLSALLTGGGTEALFAIPVGEGSRETCGAPVDLAKGEVGLLAPNVRGGVLSRGLAIGLSSEVPRLRDGQCPALCPLVSRGGEVGESMVKLGVICGEERIFIDFGRGNLPDPGDLSRLKSFHSGFVVSTADNAPFCARPVTAHGDRERGKSKDARTMGGV